MRPFLLPFAAIALMGISSSSFIPDACSQEAKPAPRTAQAQRTTVSFAEDVFPIFKGRCIDCHRPGGQGFEISGLDLATYDVLMKGTKHGPMVISGRSGLEQSDVAPRLARESPAADAARQKEAVDLRSQRDQAVDQRRGEKQLSRYSLSTSSASITSAKRNTQPNSRCPDR
jgi:hypothetical protein